MNTNNYLQVTRADRLPDKPQNKRWLIEHLWSYEAVGIIGGEPKCGKSIMALSIAVALASAKPCLGQFAVPTQGRVLLFAAEDSLPVVKQRLSAIALSYGVQLHHLNIFVVTQSSLRLDIDAEYQLLKNTIEKLSPQLLILDPFVRLHRVDENAAGEVAPLLSRLRHIQRTFHSAVIVVHHARKDSKNARAGQALRGSSEFHAWGDSNLYLKRQSDNSLLLTIEHRSERPLPAISLELESNEIGPFHKIQPLDLAPQTKPSPADKILQALRQATTPLNTSTIRSTTKLRTQAVYQTLTELTANGSISHSKEGYSLTP